MSLTKQVTFPSKRCCYLTFLDNSELYIQAFKSFYTKNVISNIMYQEFIVEMYRHKIDICYNTDIRIKLCHTNFTLYYQNKIIYRTILQEEKVSTFYQIDNLLIENCGDNIKLYNTISTKYNSLADELMLYNYVTFYKLCYISSIHCTLYDLLIDITQLNINCYRIEKIFNDNTIIQNTIAIYYIERESLPAYFTCTAFKTLNNLQIMHNIYRYENNVLQQLSSISYPDSIITSDKDIFFKQCTDYIVTICDDITKSTPYNINIQYHIILNIHNKQNDLVGDLYKIAYTTSSFIFLIDSKGEIFLTHPRDHRSQYIKYQFNEQEKEELKKLNLILPTNERKNNVVHDIMHHLTNTSPSEINKRLFNLSNFLTRLIEN